MEFQAVIMAAGRGSRMTDLTARRKDLTPKALLHVGNRPMIWYSINLLERAGFTAALVVVLKAAQQEISRALKDMTTMTLDYFTIPDDHDRGTVDSLRLIKDRIVTPDVLVISCDLVTYFPLHLLADVHRTNDATVTMLLAPAPDISDTAVPGGKANRRIERDLIGLDEAQKRLLYCSSECDLEDFLTFKISDLQRNPYLDIHTRLLDVHLYIIKSSVLELISRLHATSPSHEITMLKGDLMPYLVRTQFNDSSQSAQAPDKHLANSSIAHGDPSITHLSSSAPAMMVRRGDSVRCFAYVLGEKDAAVCLRANTLVTYCEANKQISIQHSKMNINPDQYQWLEMITSSPTQKITTGANTKVDTLTMLNEGVSVGDRSVIKSCLIGSHTKIAENTKLTNCVIMDHVNINSGVVLTGCIICEGANVLAEAELKECLVGYRQTVEKGKYTNEVIVEQQHMMHI